MSTTLNIIIVAENASARMGGEAILALHYFKFLSQQKVAVWLLTHARVKEELQAILGEEDFKRVYFIPDTKLQIFLEYLKYFIPNYLAESIIQWIIQASTGMRQRKWLKSLVRTHKIDIIHQPMPVSPRMPSFIYAVGAPVIIGPMNGGMRFPPAFSSMIGVWERLITWGGHTFSEGVNNLIPGKKKAALLLVANQRTQQALPKCACHHVLELVENGVDLTLWQNRRIKPKKYYHPPFLPSWAF